MKKFIIIIAVALIIGAAVIFKNNLTSPSTENSNLQTPSTSSIKYKDGTYTGNVSTASEFGNVQVRVVIKGSKLTDVQFLQFPDTGGHTSEVAQMAEPILKQEAISAQSANVEIVSGATQDTQAFIESLQSALDQAIQS